MSAPKLHAAEHHATLANELVENGRVVEAVEQYVRALAIRPNFPEALNNLGEALLSVGRVDDAIRQFGKALTIMPISPEIASNYLCALNYSDRLEPDMVARVHLEIAARTFASVKTRARRRTPTEDLARVRIGYVCGALHFHPAAFFMLPLLENHDRSRFEIYCYANVANPDAYTARLRRASDHWRDIFRVSDREVAKRIRRDRIDLLIDRTGHFADNRLPVFAYHAAPVQIALPGYPATTGLPSMDFRITDTVADPKGTTERWYTERLIRLSGPFACYQPPVEAPLPSALPADTAGHVTFGSFNNRQKLTERMLMLWATVLRSIPGSRLLLHHTFNGLAEVNSDFRDPIIRVFHSQGIETSRLEFLGSLPFVDHLAAFHKVDVMLDSYPYNGMTTTCESLWMSVPVISLAGVHHASRVGASFLTAVRAGSWVAETPDQYLSLAIVMGRDLAMLRRTRETLRDQMRFSPLTSARSYTRALEKAYLKVLGTSSQSAS